MPRRWSLGVDRTHYEGIDGDYDQLKKTAKAHSRHDTGKLDLSRSDKPSKDLSGPSSPDASAPQKRRWGR